MNCLHSLMPAGSGRNRDSAGPCPPSSFRGAPSKAWFCVLILALAGCAGLPLSGNAVTIKDIRDDPRTYVGHSVVIEGEVTDTMSLVLVRYFTVYDGTGSMFVVTDKTLPRKGQRMRVAGKVNDVFSFGSETTLVLMEEQGEALSGGTQRTSLP